VLQSTNSGTLTDVLDRVLDKGLIIDAWVKLSLVGVELLSLEARVVVASVETYLTYADAIGLTAPSTVPAAMPAGSAAPSTIFPATTAVRAGA
jgi:hypothetical protein